MIGFPVFGRASYSCRISTFRRRVLSASAERDRRQIVQLAADDLDVAALELAHLEQLGIRERRLQRATASEDRDVLDARGREHLDRMIGRVGARKLRRRQREHPRDVDRDVAGSDDDRMLALQVDLQPAVVGMAVVPGDELGRGMRAAQLLARDPEPPVDRRAERVQDDVVVLEQLAAGDVAAELDMPEEPEALVLGGLVVRARDRLDLRVVRGDARPHESVGSGQAVIEVDGERRLVDGQQLPGGVEAARAGADDGGAKGLGHISRGSEVARLDSRRHRRTI